MVAMQIGLKRREEHVAVRSEAYLEICPSKIHKYEVFSSDLPFLHPGEKGLASHDCRGSFWRGVGGMP